MYVNLTKILFFIYLGLYQNIAPLSSQSCKQPFFNSFNTQTTTSINVRWADTNTSPLGWELELVERGETRTSQATTPLITSKQYILENLKPATSYEVYVRTVCNETNKSVWTGPAIFTTVFTNPTPCPTNLPIKDNGTETFFIDINEAGLLGQDIFIESVDMILEHGWPADLKIGLESPSGDMITLSNHNGTITNNFGDTQDLTCVNVTSFNQNACEKIKDSRPPFIGSFVPDEKISGLANGKQSQGRWKLIFFDRALKDAGNLKYFEIKFNREKCVVPENFVVKNIGNNSAMVDWDSYGSCTTVIFNLSRDGVKINELTINCKEQNPSLKILRDLLPNTDYELTIEARCSNSNSIESCKLFFTTTCESITLRESFDSYSKCVEGCAVACNFNAPIWFNAKEESSQDWIIWNGKTDTDNTGPTTDISGIGKYLYVENNPILCGEKNNVELISRCIDIKSNASGCDMSFYYHMYGIDIQSLVLELSIDNRNTWTPLITLTGNQGDKWKRETLSLAPYDGMTGIFRFVGTSGEGPIADIAIDQIEFYKSTLANGLKRFYVDNDHDGYGIENEFIDICSSELPQGYASISGDCDDENSSINPSISEIQCNGIDENCNGNEDDSADVNPILYTSSIIDASCNGSFDGSISLNISGGTGPYTVTWPGQNQTGNTINNIKEGFYYAEIMDIGGCLKKTDFLNVKALNSLNIVISEIANTTCQGINDGIITIEHNINNPPYTYLWSNGAFTKNVMNLKAGEYSVTVTDANLCTASISKIIVNDTPSLLSGIESIKHPTCHGMQNGFISAIVQNGSGNYRFQWNTGDTTRLITNLPAGDYSLTVYDQNGCESFLTTKLVAPDSIKVVPVSIEDVRCFGESNGSIKTNSTGGTPPYTYLWTGIRTTDDIFNLAAGRYTLTVTDALGCRSIPLDVDVTQPELFEISIDSINPSMCRLGKNGYVSLITQGGTEDYSYAWSHSDISIDNFSDLISGNYNVTAYDIFGCKSSIPIIFIPYNNVPILSELNIIRENKCSEDRIGSIVSNVINGKSPFDFNWSHGVQYIKNTIVDTVTQLPSGNYMLTITDAEGCVGVSPTVTIKEIKPITYQISDVIENICNTDSNAVISIEVDGGTGVYNIAWNVGEGETINHLANGLYLATITDENNCQKITESIQISSTSDIKVEGQLIHDIDNNEIGEICLDIFGAIEPLEIIWEGKTEKTSCISGLTSGNYVVQIIDALGCIFTTSFDVQNTSSTEESNISPTYIYPNPTNGYISVHHKSEIREIQVLSLNGDKIKTILPNKSNEIQILDITNLASGIYYLKIICESSTSMHKVIKL